MQDGVSATFESFGSFGSHNGFTVFLFGPFEVRLPGGQRLRSLRTHKGEWLLALLILRDGRAVAREWLAGLLWQDSEPNKALYNLRRCLTDLRDALGPDAGRLLSPTTRTIALNLTNAFIDVHQFDAGIAEATPEGLRQAVTLYRGPLMEGCDEEWVGPERGRRTESYLNALERLAAMALEALDFAKSAALLRDAVARDPTRETAQRALMTALARSGDFGASVEAYQRLRVYLRENMNLEPDAETQRLMQQIREQARRAGERRAEPSPTRSQEIPVPDPVPDPVPVTPSASLTGDLSEPVGGAMPLDSRFYIERSTDEGFFRAILRQDSVVLVKGPRQVGKTSLLSRGLQAAREAGQRVAVLDLQKLSLEQRESTDSLYLAMTHHLYERLELATPPSAVWDADSGPNENLERYLRRHVLRSNGQDTSLVWALDEVDLLFDRPYSSEVFALFRSWHNERALDPYGPWARLTLCIAYATEAHLFINDLNQSPFNVGTRLALDDFTPDEVSELAQRYGGLLASPSDRERFLNLVGGHPYLVRRGLSEISGGLNLLTLEVGATREDGPFSDHLRRLLFLLQRDTALGDAIRAVLQNRPCPPGAPFYRLRSAGVILGESPQTARLRCGLYANYLGNHFL